MTFNRHLAPWALAAAACAFTATALPAFSQTAAATPVSAEIAAAFKRADTNGDGKLSKEEAANMPAIAARFDELDKDKDGFLSLEEFAAGMSSVK